MTPEEIKQKRVDYIQDVIFKYTTEEPKLNTEEVIFATLFHLNTDDIETIIKKLRKEVKSKF